MDGARPDQSRVSSGKRRLSDHYSYFSVGSLVGRFYRDADWGTLTCGAYSLGCFTSGVNDRAIPALNDQISLRKFEALFVNLNMTKNV